MFLKRSTSIQKGRTYHSILLTQSYRDRADGKNKHRTVANLSDFPPEEIEAIDFALKNKKDLPFLVNLRTAGKKQEKSIGAIYILHEVAKRLGIVKALGNTREAKLCLWMTIGRLIQPGLSRLAVVRLADRHMAKVTHGNGKFNFIPEPLLIVKLLVDALDLSLPEIFPTRQC